MSISSYLTEKEAAYHFTGNLLKVYVPNKYIDSPLFQEKENYIKVFGILPIALCDKDGKPTFVEIMKAPYPVTFFNIIYDNEKNKSFFGSDKMDFRAYSFYNGERVMRSTIENSNDNLDIFLKYIMSAKICNFIKYDDLIKAFDKLLIDNKINLNVPHSVKETLITASIRNPKKLEELFATVVGKNPNTDPHKYICINNRQVVASSSISTGLAFEDIDTMIISGINATTQKKKLPDSPIETILTL